MAPLRGAAALALVAAAWTSGVVASPKPQDAPAAAKIDALFAAWNRPDSPGCGVGVSRDGVITFERGYGMANLDAKIAISPATVFHVASISKQFTAMSILLLAQRGRLSLDDEVGKHIPGWALPEGRVTIRHLLSHTGGLRDAFQLSALIPPRDDRSDLNEDLVRVLARQRGLNFAPGAEFQYSNSGYVLLAHIVKRLSGQSLRAFADVNIFKPLGMTHTHVHDDPAMAVPHRAVGYRPSGDDVKPIPHADLGRLVGTTGVLTTVRDLLRWQRNFTDVRVGNAALVTAMQTPVTLANGSPAPYGFGLWIEPDGELRTIGHGGGDPGFAAHVRRYPDRGIAVAVLCNIDSVGPRVGDLTRRVARIVLGQEAPSSGAAAAPAPVKLSAEQLAGKTGLYRDVERDAFGRIFMRDGTLRAAGGAGKGENDSVALTAVSANRFIIPGTDYAFDFVTDATGEAREMRITGEGPKPSVLQKVEPFSPSAEELRALAGDYNSADLDVTYQVMVRDSGLLVRIPGRGDSVLDPVFPDTFTGGGLDTLTFVRDAQGRITAVVLKSGGVRHLRFERIRAAPAR